MKNDFEDLILPDGVEMDASHADDNPAAELSGGSVSVAKEAKPAPASGYNNDIEDEVESSLSEKFSVMQKVEKLSYDLDNVNHKTVVAQKNLDTIGKKCASLVDDSTQLKQIFGDMEAKYLVTQNEVREFEDSLRNYFKTALKAEAEKIVGDAIWDMKHARKEQVEKFTYEIKGGFWLSTAMGICLVAFFVISYAVMALITYLK